MCFKFVWLYVKEWTDDRLTWAPEKFGNLYDIILKADKIWLPEIAVMNGLVPPTHSTLL